MVDQPLHLNHWSRIDPHEFVSPPEGGKVGAFKAGVLKGDFVHWCRYSVGIVWVQCGYSVGTV